MIVSNKRLEMLTKKPTRKCGTITAKELSIIIHKLPDEIIDYEIHEIKEFFESDAFNVLENASRLNIAMKVLLHNYSLLQLSLLSTSKLEMLLVSSFHNPNKYDTV